MIVVCGENLIDYVKDPEGDVAYPGGSPFNVAMGLGQLGLKPVYVTPISTDKWGDMLASRLEEMGVTIGAARNPAPTSMAIVTIKDGSPSYEFKRTDTAERAVTRESLEADFPHGATAVHIGSLALADGSDADAWAGFCRKSYEDGLLICVDPNVRGSIIEDFDAYRVRIMEMLSYAHIVKLSDEDLEALYPDLALEAAFAELRAHTAAGLVILTKGKDGGEAFFGDQSNVFTAHPVRNLKDSVGAGDTFMANILGWLEARALLTPQAVSELNAEQVSGALAQATCAAALNCETSGCNPPTQADIDSALAG